MSNRLANESSLYLRQHAENPVDWHPWGDEALARARAENKPIFLSIGYSACHWCHVMEHESFEDHATAAVMNEHYVCIKVDREERPDLDQIYMTSLQLLTREGGGWPLSVFLTPSLMPFYAGTYFPPREAYGRPSFRRVLLAVAESWRAKPEQMIHIGSQVAEALQDSLAVASREGELNEATLKRALETLKRNYEPKYGGFGHAPKFPHAIDLRLLLRLGQRFDDPQAVEIVSHTLTMMARGGIFDQVGGGFARYSVDEKWLVPHFEKMLYDNALLVPAYLETYQVTGDDYYLDIARRILGYIHREMTSPHGSFYSAQDADSEGEEGKFFVWSEAEIDEHLGDDAAFARSVWGVSHHGNFEGHNILCRARADTDDAARLGLTLETFRAKLKALEDRLYAVRAKRVWPGRDEKILTAWNGMMIAACAKAATVLQSPDALIIAIVAMEYLLAKLRTPQGQLLRTCGDDHPAKLAAYLEDYAFTLDALVELYDATLDARWLREACTLADIMIADYFDAAAGGFFYTLPGQGDLIARAKDWHDGSTPSGNAVAATVLLKLATLCDRSDYREAAEKALDAFRGLVNDNPGAAAQMLIALDWHLGPVREIAILGTVDEAALASVRAKSFQPRQLLAIHRDGEPAKNVALLRNKPLPANGVATYICQNYQCAAAQSGVAAAIAACNRMRHRDRGCEDQNAPFVRP